MYSSNISNITDKFCIPNWESSADTFHDSKLAYHEVRPQFLDEVIIDHSTVQSMLHHGKKINTFGIIFLD